MDGPPQSDVFNQTVKQPVPPNKGLTLNPRYWANFFATTTRTFVTPGTYESSRAYITMTELGTKASSTFAPYDQ